MVWVFSFLLSTGHDFIKILFKANRNTPKIIVANTLAVMMSEKLLLS